MILRGNFVRRFDFQHNMYWWLKIPPKTIDDKQVINSIQMYDINISSLWYGAMATQVHDSCFVELYSQYSSLMRESNERYTKDIEKEEYYAERHFHFVYLFEKWSNRNGEIRTGLQNINLGYIVSPNRTINKAIWKKEIKSVLKKELPKQLKNNTLENTNILLDKILSPDTSNEEREISLKFQMGRHTVEERRLDTNNIEEAERWVYDIYWFRHSRIVLTYSKEDLEERKYFTYFFAWSVVIIEIEELDEFLKYHFVKNFENNWNSYGRFLEILLMKHDGTLFNANHATLIKKWLVSNPYDINIPTNQLEKNLKIEDNSKKPGRKPVEKIKIPKPIIRGKNDNRTIFTKDETAKLFGYLAQLNCVFMGKPDMSKASFASAIEALTGFSAGQMETELIYEDWMPKNKKEKIVTLENLKELINSKL